MARNKKIEKANKAAGTGIEAVLDELAKSATEAYNGFMEKIRVAKALARDPSAVLVKVKIPDAMKPRVEAAKRGLAAEQPSDQVLVSDVIGDGDGGGSAEPTAEDGEDVAPNNPSTDGKGEYVVSKAAPTADATAPKKRGRRPGVHYGKYTMPPFTREQALKAYEDVVVPVSGLLSHTSVDRLFGFAGAVNGRFVKKWIRNGKVEANGKGVHYKEVARFIKWYYDRAEDELKKSKAKGGR